MSLRPGFIGPIMESGLYCCQAAYEIDWLYAAMSVIQQCKTHMHELISMWVVC